MISASLVKELREKSGAGMMDCKKALAENNGDINAAMEFLREKGIANANKRAGRIASEGLTNIYLNNNKAVIIELNSETDFVSKNSEFKALLDTIGNAILNSEAKTYEECGNVATDEGTVDELIINKISKIGEKLSFRRCEIITKEEDEVFGNYLHMGGRIAVLSILKNTTEDVAREVSMQAAAMNPEYIFPNDIPQDVLDRERNILKEQAITEGKPEDVAVKMVEGRIKKYIKEVCLSEQAFIKDSNIDVKTYVTNNGGEILKVIRYEVGEGMEKRNDDFASEVMNQVKGS